MLHIGIIEDTEDPLKLGRCKVRVVGVHNEKLSSIKTDDLPWASVMMPATSASVSGIGYSPSGLLEGSMVVVMFIDGVTKQQPLIIGSLHGIPLDKGLYTKESEENIIKFDLSRPDEIVNSTTLESDSGEAVVDSSGMPVQTDTAKEKTKEQLEVELNDVTLIPTTPPAGSGGSKDGIEAIVKVCKEKGITSRRVVASILGICGGESRWKPQSESFKYTKSRLLEVFPSVFNGNEALAEEASKNQQTLPELLYGHTTSKGKGLGNTQAGDGAKYIGRGLIQLTGRANYARYSGLSGTDILNNPDLLNSSLEVSAKVAVAYVLDRTKLDHNNPNYFEAAKKAVGFNTPDIAAKKKSYYDYFMGGPQPVGEDAAAASEEQKTSTQSPKEFNFSKQNQEVIAKSPSASGLGFKDPNGKYPLYTKEQDTSRLSRNQKIAESIVKRKNDNRTVSIPKIYGEWEEQRSPYSTLYPHNKVFETHSGHVIEIDDSPGSERIHIYHRSGTYVEVDNTGSMTTRIVGSNYEIVDRNDHLYVKGALNITVGGACNVLVGGTMTAYVQGSALVSVTDDVKVRGSNVFVEASETLNLKSGSELNISSSTINIKSSGSLNMDGAPINQNSGASKAATGTGLSSPGESKNIVLENPQPNTFDRQTEISFESSDDGDYTQHQKKLIESGLATPEQLAAKPEEGEKVEDLGKKDNDDLIPATCADIAMLNDFPASLQLSPNFTLGQVSSNAAVTKQKVVSQNGLEKEVIICNLQNICLNVLEPIKKMYPNMLVTSAFRAGSGGSQHLKGEAVDIQFNGISKSDYFVVARKLAEELPVFDQLLLEYKNYGTKNPWIHISCTRGKNRRQVLTLWNDTTYAQGLVDLGTKA